MRNNRKSAMLLGGVLGLLAVHIYANKAEKPVAYTTEEARAIAATRLINIRDYWKSLNRWTGQQSEVLKQNPEADVDYADIVNPAIKNYVEEGDPNHPEWNKARRILSIGTDVYYGLLRDEYILKHFDQLSDKTIKSFVSETDSHPCMLSDVSKLYQTAKFEEEHPSLTKKIADGAKGFGRGVAYLTSMLSHNTALNISVIWANWAAQFTDWYGLNLLCVPWYLVKTVGCTLCPIWSVSLDEYQDERLGRLGLKEGLHKISLHEQKVEKALGDPDARDDLRYWVKSSKIKESGGYFFDKDTSHFNSWY